MRVLRLGEGGGCTAHMFRPFGFPRSGNGSLQSQGTTQGHGTRPHNRECRRRLCGRSGQGLRPGGGQGLCKLAEQLQEWFLFGGE